MSRIPNLEALTDGAVAAFRADLERIIGRLTAFLQAKAEELAVTGDGLLEGGEANVELADKLAGDLGNVIQELGYDESVGRLLDDLETAHDAISGAVGDTLGASFTAASHTTLEAFASGLVDDLLSMKGEAAAALREALLIGIRTNLPRDREIAAVADAVGITLRRAVTLVDTSMMAFQREALVSQSEEAGIDLFAYTGPDDSLIRPFCQDHVGRVYTAADLDTEDNGEGLTPTSRYLGGYNCRHYLSPVTVERARELGGDAVAGELARAIVFGGQAGQAEARFVARFRGSVISRGGRQQVVRPRAA